MRSKLTEHKLGSLSGQIEATAEPSGAGGDTVNALSRLGADLGMVGESAYLRWVLTQVGIVAPTNSTVLILGETGTGKELLARAIHNLSQRRNRRFVATNCSAIPAGLLESELFGHEKGAFTGAIGRGIGRFELAGGGTVFLDEVGDIPLELQSKLLRVLQGREIERLGSARTVHVDYRLVAATNQNLAQMVERGMFRSDLYYRLNVFPIEVAPLRKRQEDIPLLVWHFVRKHAERMNKRIETIREEDMEALVHYSWPGNVRELQNMIERCVILTSSTVLESPSLAAPRKSEEPKRTVLDSPSLAEPRRSEEPKLRTLAEAEREVILQALGNTSWVVGGPHGAAAQLAVRRTTLLAKMRRLGISRPMSEDNN